MLSQLTLIDTLTLENTQLKTHNQRMEGNLEQYKDTLKKMYLQYSKQQSAIENLKDNQNQYVTNYQKVNVENSDLNVKFSILSLQFNWLDFYNI